MKTKTNKLLAMLLAVMMVVGMFPTSAFALETASENNTTEKFINEADGREIAPAQESKETEAKEPQTIVGYEYQSYSQVTEHVYAKEDLTYILGYPDKTVQGERNLSRSEAVAIFYRLYDGMYPTPQRQMTSTTFSDVPTDAWYYTELELCYNVGIVNGNGSGEFNPHEAITRAEFAAMAVRFAELVNSDKAMFNDVTKDHWAYLAINAAAEAGWVKGYPDGTYRADTSISRAETVTLINRLRNRVITADELKAMGVENPYTDLVETYWAYADLLEATIKHAAADWHDLSYNDGNLNIIIEKYVDSEGNEIAEAITSQGKENNAYRQFDKHYYLGYITTITYVYTDGTANIEATKSVDKSTAKVGDTLIYTITVGNAEDATANLENVVMSDIVSEYLNFSYGSIQVDGVAAKYSYTSSTRELLVELGDIAAGQTKAITFTAIINDTAYGQTIENTAIIKADNDNDEAVTDNGVAVDAGIARINIASKTVDKSAASVGDTLTYTITVGNIRTATASLENVVITDAIPSHLNFSHGSVQVDGVTAQYSYNSSTKELSIALGDIVAGQTMTITFSAIINATAYGMEFKNTAVISADNVDNKPVTDDGVTVDAGIAEINIASKKVDKSTASVGDTLTYTIVVGNDRTATASLENVVITDVISSYLNFSYGSVHVDGVSARYSYSSSSRELLVELGDIAAGQTKTITFTAIINDTAYGQSFENTAVIKADNENDKLVTDNGVTVGDGVAQISIASKAVDKAAASVGDTLNYTIVVGNNMAATTSLENVVITDSVPSYLNFSHGSVQVDGVAASYSYNSDTKELVIELGNIAAGQTKIITFSATVNSTAYDKTFKNTAIISADNAKDKTVSDNGVTVGSGTAEGSVGAKTVSTSTAKVGDTLTYTITLRNSALATAAWTDVTVTDVIPEYLSFISGSVEENGRSSNNYGYNANSKTLSLYADSIGVGETKTFTFKVVVDEGAQGMFIVNTAQVSSDGREDIQLPDTGVQIDAGETAPIMTKSASVSEAMVGDIFTYTVTVKNGANATAPWKNVILTDVLPTGVKLVSGSVTLNGQTVSYGISGQAIEVTVGTLKAGEDAVISFDVRVLENAEGTTVENLATARGSNGDKTATDNGVTVPKLEVPSESDEENSVAGAKTVDKTLVNTGDKVTYTITATNNTEESWTGVQVYDVLDTSVLTLINDSIYVDGIRFLSGSGKWTFTDRQLVVNLGNIEAGKTVKVEFTVQFKNDAANSSFINYATIRSVSHDSVYVKSPEVIISGSNGGETPNNYSEVHYKLFIGYDDGEWKPTTNIRLDNMAMLAYRLMTDYYRSSIGNGSIAVPESINYREVQYFVSHGVLSAAEVAAGGDATQSQIYRLLNFAIGGGLSSNSSAYMTRASVATLICNLTGRDTTPNTNGLSVAYFPDKGSYTSLIDEVSNSHDYTLDSNGNETWISILND